jgi:hypothetical protein
MRIKHSKYKNTGLIYELLVRQIAADTISNRTSPAIKILKKYYGNSSFFAKEFKLYEFILKNKAISRDRAESIISTITEISRKLDTKSIKNQKYKLIAEIKEHYNLEDFFSISISTYKPLAALYCLIEAQNNNELVDPQVIVENKMTILEYLTAQATTETSTRESLIEEYSKYEKDLKLLTYKILLEKFNNKYVNLNVKQKEVLREFITSVASSTRLKDFVNGRLEEISKSILQAASKSKDAVLKIKLQEVNKNIKYLSKKDKVQDNNLALLMQYYELIQELNTK